MAPKTIKSSKINHVQPLLLDYKGFVVIVWGGCRVIGNTKSMIWYLEVGCDGIWLRVRF